MGNYDDTEMAFPPRAGNDGPFVLIWPSRNEECVHRLTETQTPTPSLPRWQGSTQRCAAVGEYVSIAVGVIVVLPSFRWPWTFYLQRCKASVRQINIQSVIDKQTMLFVSSLELKRAVRTSVPWPWKLSSPFSNQLSSPAKLEHHSLTVWGEKELQLWVHASVQLMNTHHTDEQIIRNSIKNASFKRIKMHTSACL